MTTFTIGDRCFSIAFVRGQGYYLTSAHGTCSQRFNTERELGQALAELIHTVPAVSTKSAA